MSLTQARHWSSEFELGCPELDEDHRAMFNIVNRVGRELERRSVDRAIALMHHFLETSRYHFEREEVLMRDIGFPGVTVHIGYHALLISRAEGFIAQCEAGRELEFVRDLHAELVNCLLDDVICGDREFALFLR